MQHHARFGTAAAADADAGARADALRHNFLSCLILAAQNGFGPFLALSWETWGEEQLWAAVKDLPHGCARKEGPARQHAAGPFGFDLFWAPRTPSPTTRAPLPTLRGCGG